MIVAVACQYATVAFFLLPRHDHGGPRSRPLRDERMAANEALFREVNERIFDATAALADWPWGGPSTRIDFVCECGHAECFEQIQLTREEYERVRASAVRFVIKAGTRCPSSSTSSTNRRARTA